MINTLERIKGIKGTQDLREIFCPLKVSLVIIWGTYQGIVLSKKNNSRRETRSSMPMQLKMMTQLKRRTVKMKTSE